MRLLPPLLAQEASDLERACGEDVGPICNFFFNATDGNVLVTSIAGNLIPTLLKIALIIVIAFVANRAMKRLIKRFVHDMTEKGISKLGALTNKAPLKDTRPIDMARAQMRTETIAGVLRSVATVVIWTIAAVMVLGSFDINLGPLIAGAGIVGVAVGFGAQDLVKDFLSGIFMLLEDQYGIGDIINIDGTTGTVEAISLRSTRIRDIQGTVWYVPNGEIRQLGNFSQEWARSLLDIGVAYDTDLDHAFVVIKRTADEVNEDPEWGYNVLDEPTVWGVQDFGASEIVIRLVMKVRPLKQWAVEREVRRRLKLAFDREGIEIPFPQQTTWMRYEGDYTEDGNGDTALTQALRQQKRADRRP